ncbi:MAG: glycosyltransferase family 2 protein [Blastocatellia bacterium]
MLRGVAVAILPKRRFLKEFTLSLPFTILEVVSWSVGEFFGYLAGPGTSRDLQRCLDSLHEQSEAADMEMEIIAVGNYSTGDLRSRYTRVKFVAMPISTTVPQLRMLGIAQSRGEIVALIEDHCVVDENWSAEIKRAHELHTVFGENCTAPFLLFCC